MKLYRITDTGRFVATQAEAKAETKTSRSMFAQVEVPTSDGREALADYLNGLLLDFAPAPAFAEAEMPTPPVAQVAETIREGQEAAYTARDIEDFILNRASVNQAANILSCLGTVFAETVKERRNG